MKYPLCREDGSVVDNCCWSSPAQSSSGPSPAGLMTTFYCLRFETPPTWRARPPYLCPLGTGLPGYTPRHWVSISSPPTTRRATVEVLEPASTRDVHPCTKLSPCSSYIGTDHVENSYLLLLYSVALLIIFCLATDVFPLFVSRERVYRAVAH
jgi:hypothetical protein